MEMNPFEKQASLAYAEGPPRKVPGYASLHRMITMLLAERVAPDGRLLVLGAGGGLELKAFADAQPGWNFDGVDPSADMLRVAQDTVAPFADRVRLHEGTIDVAPEGPYDGATALLTFHFIPRAERQDVLRQIHRRLKPGAPLVLVHLSFPQTEPERSLWIARHVAFGEPDGVAPDQVARSRQAMASKLTILAPDEDEAMLREAGFSGVALFYAGLSLRGWVAYRLH